MGNVDLSILNDLTAFDSATVQNADTYQRVHK